MRLLDRVFVDSGGWIAYFNEDDLGHHQALAAMAQIEKAPFKLFTSSFVISETATYFAYHHGPEATDKFTDYMRNLVETNILDIFYINAATMLAGLDCMRDHRHLKLSLTDATNYVLVKREKLDRIFAFDDDFRKLGLDCIPQ